MKYILYMKNIYEKNHELQEEGEQGTITSHDTRHRKTQKKSSGGQVKTNKKM